MADGYDPSRSKVSADTMETWRTSAVTGDLIEVPGIGPAAIKALRSSNEELEKITNTYQLFGKYLMLKGPDDDYKVTTIAELNQKFWYFLKAIGINSFRSAVVLAVSEKVASFFPGFYDANTYQEDDDDDDE